MVVLWFFGENLKIFLVLKNIFLVLKFFGRCFDFFFYKKSSKTILFHFKL